VEGDQLDVGEVGERSLVDEVVRDRPREGRERGRGRRGRIEAVRVEAVDREPCRGGRLERRVGEDVIGMPVRVQQLDHAQATFAQRRERLALALGRVDEDRVAAVVGDDVHAVVERGDPVRMDVHLPSLGARVRGRSRRIGGFGEHPAHRR